MRPFAALERFFERVIERPSARLFHARLQPIQLQRRVERAMETGRLSAADRVMVPNRYVVRLAPADVGGFGDLAPSLELELADAALRFARSHHYTVSDRPAVRLVADREGGPGDVRVVATFSDRPPPVGRPADAPVEVPARRDPAAFAIPASSSAGPGGGGTLAPVGLVADHRSFERGDHLDSGAPGAPSSGRDSAPAP